MPPPTLADINKYLKALDVKNPHPPGSPLWNGNLLNKPWLDSIYNDGIVELWRAVVRLERMAYFGETWSDVGGPVIADAPGGPGPGKTPPPPPPSYPP